MGKESLENFFLSVAESMEQNLSHHVCAVWDSEEEFQVPRLTPRPRVLVNPSLPCPVTPHLGTLGHQPKTATSTPGLPDTGTQNTEHIQF